MKGSYILLMELSRDETIKIGKLGRIKFERGSYAYVGSAMNNLEKRVERHLRKRREKKMHWHIDYFLKKAKVKDIFLFGSNKKRECIIAEKLAKNFSEMKNFGCSDCKCKSHLFYLGGKKYKKYHHLFYLKTHADI